MIARNDTALRSLVRRLATYAKAMDISSSFLPAIAPAAFGVGSLRMDALGDPPLYVLDRFDRGQIGRVLETKDEDVLVEYIMAEVIEWAAYVGALKSPPEVADDSPERKAVVRAMLLARLGGVPGAAALVKALA